MLHEVLAHGAAVLGPVDARHGRAAGGGYLREVHTALGQTLDGGVGVRAHVVDEVHVAQIVAALVGVGREKFHAVLDALGFLQLRAAGVHASLGEAGVAAGHIHLLQQYDARAAVVRAHGGRHARAARADDDRVVRAAVSQVVGDCLLRRAAREPRERRSCEHARTYHAAQEQPPVHGSAADPRALVTLVHGASPSLFLGRRSWRRRCGFLGREATVSKVVRADDERVGATPEAGDFAEWASFVVAEPFSCGYRRAARRGCAKGAGLLSWAALCFHLFRLRFRSAPAVPVRENEKGRATP